MCYHIWMLHMFQWVSYQLGSTLVLFHRRANAKSAPNPNNDPGTCEWIGLINLFQMQWSVNRCTCKWAVPTGGGTLGSKGIRANGARAAGVGPLITGNGGVAGVLNNGCLRGNAPATGGPAPGNRGADCCAILLLQKNYIESCNQKQAPFIQQLQSPATSHFCVRLRHPVLWLITKLAMNIAQ